MGVRKVVGLVLLVAGTLALVYGGFSYPKETHEAKVGPMEIEVQEKERVNIPVWVGVGMIVGGGLVLAFGGDRREAS